MAADVEAHVGDTGTILRITVRDGSDPLDLSAATSLNLVVRDAAQHVETLTGALVTDGSDGVVDFTTTSTTWTYQGVAQEQVQLVFPSGSWSAAIIERQIGRRLA